MSKRDWRLLLEDIEEAIQKIERYVEGLRAEEFKATPMAVDAVVRNFEIIGEASRVMPEEIKRKLHDLPWNKMAGLRNRIVHEYFGVDLDNIWFIVQNELPELKKQIQSALKKK